MTTNPNESTRLERQVTPLVIEALAKMASGRYDMVLRTKGAPLTPPEFIEYVPDVAVSIAHRCASIEGRAVAMAMSGAGKAPPDPTQRLTDAQVIMREQIMNFMDTTIDGSRIERLWVLLQRNSP